MSQDSKRIVDATALVMEKLVEDVDHDYRKAVFMDLQVKLRASHPLPPTPTPRRWDAPGMAAFYEQVHQTLVTILVARAARFSKLGWLWYSRRLPSALFAGRLGSTGAYMHSLYDAVALAGGHDRSEIILSEGTARFPIDTAVARELVRMVEGIELLYNVQVRYRLAGKNVGFVSPQIAGEPGYLPVPRAVDPAWEAVRDYDARHEAEPGIARNFQGTGTIVGVDGTPEDAILLVGPVRPTWITTPAIKGEEFGASYKEIFSRFGLQIASISDVGELDRKLGGIGTPWLDTGVVDYIVLSRIMFLAVLEISYGLVDILQYGYLCMRFEVFATYFSDCAGEIHGYLSALSPGLAVPEFDAFMTRLSCVDASLWPPRPRPIVHRTGDAIYLDVVSATLQLRDALEFPPLQGAVANIRSEHFEPAVCSLP